MNVKRTSAFICGLAMVCQQLPAYGAVFAEGKKTVTLGQITPSMVDVSSKEYDGTTLAEVDLSRIPLNGVESGDDVYLACKAEFYDANAGKDKTVRAYDLRLEGSDAGKYDLRFNGGSQLQLKADIFPRTIYVEPAEGCFVYDNAAYPQEVEYSFMESCDAHEKCILDKDRELIKADARLWVDNEDGSFTYELRNDTASGSPNYIFELGSEHDPEVRAPEELLISETIVYRNDASFLEQFPFGIVADDTVDIVVSARSKVNYNSVTFTLDDGRSEEAYVEIIDGMYVYSAEFSMTLEDGALSDRLADCMCSIDNGTYGDYQDIYFKIDGRDEVSKVLIIDKKAPGVVMSSLKNSGEEKRFYADLILKDFESGIRSIRYRWDADWDENSQWIDIDPNTYDHSPKANVSFRSSVKWEEGFDTRPYTEGSNKGCHKLHLEITDNAGNVYHDKGNFITNGSDTMAPEATYIRLEKDTDTAWDNIVHFLSFGNFVNSKIQIDLKVADMSESAELSGVKIVELLDGNGDDAKVIDWENGKEDAEQIYTFVLDPKGIKSRVTIIDALYLRLTDKQGNTAVYSVKDLLTSDIAGDDTDAAPDLSNVKSDKWIFDYTAPEMKVDWGDPHVYDGTSGIHYYNNDGGKLRISVSDENGLGSWRVTPIYRADLSDEGEAVDAYELIKEFHSVKKNDSYELDTAVLETGWYTIEATAADNAGNVLETFNAATFYVDHELPAGRMELISPEPVEIDGEYWIKERTDGGLTTMGLRMYLESESSGIGRARVSINDKSSLFTFNSGDIITDEETGETYVEFEVTPDEKAMQGGLSYNDDHTYRVSANIWSNAENYSSTEYKFHVDTESPSVDRYYVEKSNSAAETVLNILSFGVFANDSLTFIAEVSDNGFDSGIDGAVISYDGLDEPAEMEKIGDGKYSYRLPLDTDVFKSEIVVTVRDKMGKESSSCPDIRNTSGDKSTVNNHFTMMETVPPMIKIDLPEGDCAEKKDGRIWYRRHKKGDNDDEKFISLVVSDADSGISYVKMTINGRDVTDMSGQLEAKGNALPTAGYTASQQGSITGAQMYKYSVEKIAEMIPANADGSYIIELRAVDNAGNAVTSPISSSGEGYSDDKVVYYRDIFSPEIVQFMFTPASVDDIVNTEDFLESMEYGFYFKKDFVANIAVADPNPSSGGLNAMFKLVPYNNGEQGTAVTEWVKVGDDNTATYLIKAGFKGQIFAMASDNVGNESYMVTPRAFVSEDTAPVITISSPGETSNKDPEGNKLYTGDVSFTVTIEDYESGLREISYSKSSEKDSRDTVVTYIDNGDGVYKDVLDNGWVVEARDMNLITKVSKTFTFTEDDNNIFMTFNAEDRSRNETKGVNSDKFTIDTIPPQITIVNENTPVNSKFYKESTSFTITVNERNFSDELIARSIAKTYGDTLPILKFSNDPKSTVHTATVTFPEGDYTFSLSGRDMGMHEAEITYVSGSVKRSVGNSFYQEFNVDNTAPIVSTNFGSFGADGDKEIYFSKKHNTEIVINITEHNFTSDDVHLQILCKDAGSEHGDNGFSLYTGGNREWTSVGNNNELRVPLEDNKVYKVTIAPTDRVGHEPVISDGTKLNTAVFEVDTIEPIFDMRRDIRTIVNEDESTDELAPFCVLYTQAEKDLPAPSIIFKDTNIKSISYEYEVCTPSYSNEYEMDYRTTLTGSSSVEGGVFDLTELQSGWKAYDENGAKPNGTIPDGAYTLKLTAVDKAGNVSKPIDASYIRMVNSDVLAYINNSVKPADENSMGEGFYSIMDENGVAISKKATSFKDIEIIVIKAKDDTESGKIALREEGKEPRYLSDNADFKVETTEISPTVIMEKMVLPGSYFSETFPDNGLEARMELSATVREGIFQWLGSIHIDNEVPSASVPEKFTNWHNYLFKKEVEVTLTGINETLDKQRTKVYECDRKGGERKEIPFSYVKSDNTLSFKLDKGVHHIDIVLVDEAGNEWNVDRVRYVRVGNFRLYVVLGSVLAVAGMIVLIAVIRKKKRIA